MLTVTDNGDQLIWLYFAGLLFSGLTVVGASIIGPWRTVTRFSLFLFGNVIVWYTVVLAIRFSSTGAYETWTILYLSPLAAVAVLMKALRDRKAAGKRSS